jgi:transcriptional regulator with XRE-family HTH domain
MRPLTREERRDYAIAAAQDAAFDAVAELWRKRKAAGVRKSDLADRLGRDRGWVTRSLSGPRNWTLRTLGELAEALDGDVEIVVIGREEPARHNFDAYAVAGVRAPPAAPVTRAAAATLTYQLLTPAPRPATSTQAPLDTQTLAPAAGRR